MRLFVTGIGTEVGKTIISAILTEALEADYWKPVQAGDLDCSDTDKVRDLVSNTKSVFHSATHALNHPMSPHAAAERDGVEINLEDFVEPETLNHIVIEGAGGLMVPINRRNCIVDVIENLDAEVVLVSRNYLGSINHTLLSIEALKNRGLKIKGIIFNDVENVDTESVILEMTGLKLLGRVDLEDSFTKEIVRWYAEKFKLVL
ncbi:MAG: dethiobiotin synthase [Crocinitomicaceae bacterium]|nr:dethiobiotin synthase [Crocinitomicaceae bacterium]|tara:strand:- start:5766 stop:6377 length:612 start_codon:yes stop_codon:yes gene_type:complete